MAPDVTLLVLTAASIGFVHTLLGPDHYLPFAALSRARAWSTRRTVVITSLCGVGHVLSSIIIGAVGIAAGTTVERLVGIEAFRGDIAAWLLFGFGLAYTAWGLKRALRGATHSHEHSHADGSRHAHDHDHRLAPHLHPHGLAAGAAGPPVIERVEPVAGSTALAVTPWALFIIFLFGPCEPLIPVLMYPASHASWLAILMVCLAFGIATLATMLAVVLLVRRGLQSVDLRGFERWSHAIAGSTIALCGVGILLLGHGH